MIIINGVQAVLPSLGRGMHADLVMGTRQSIAQHAPSSTIW